METGTGTGIETGKGIRTRIEIKIKIRTKTLMVTGNCKKRTGIALGKLQFNLNYLFKS
jgi:hypothetical protein